MRDPYDVWFIRFPDGRVVRAKSTTSVRHHVELGRVPLESWVRRRGEDDWNSLEWTVEFADLVVARRKQLIDAVKAAASPVEVDVTDKQKAPLSRNQHELHTVGVRGLVEELLAALDSTLHPRKLAIAALTCLLGAALVAARLHELFDGESPWADWPPVGLGVLAIFGMGAGLLTRITFVELSRLRQARSKEILSSLGGFCPRIMGCHVLVGGTVVLAVAGLRSLPGWVQAQEISDMSASGILSGIAVVVSLILQAGLWALLGLSLLLAPVVVVEEVAMHQAITQWWALVRQNLGRVILYESLAIALGSVMTLPFLMPVMLASVNGFDFATPGVAGTTRALLVGCALTPLVAYTVVANVFIYLNLRYEFSTSARE